MLATCDSQDPSLISIPVDELESPPVSVVDFLEAIGNVRESVGSESLRRQEDWTKLYGMDG